MLNWGKLGISLQRILRREKEPDEPVRAPDTYESRMKEQIEQYREVKNIHDLPEIFHYWSNKFLRPRLNEVLRADSIAEFYADSFARTYRGQRRSTSVFSSIGSGDCSTEIAVVKRLLASGLRNFSFKCLEVSPHLVERAALAIRSEGLERIMSVECVDLNLWTPDCEYVGIMANHSLHHLLKLEQIFDAIKSSLEPNGVFVTNDVIGRNGHMRWPEALEVIEGIWAFLPDRFKFNRQLNRFEDHFGNWDCSVESFEGVRAQDILPILVEKFHFRAFLAYGGVIDIFTDRSFGHNFDPNEARDRALIDFINFLNDVLIDDGLVKPTMMFSVMVAEPVAKIQQWRHWSPEFSIRKP